jgi:hypothetical protein
MTQKIQERRYRCDMSKYLTEIGGLGSGFSVRGPVKLRNDDDRRRYTASLKSTCRTKIRHFEARIFNYLSFNFSQTVHSHLLGPMIRIKTYKFDSPQARLHVSESSCRSTGPATRAPPFYPSELPCTGKEALEYPAI